MGHAGIGGAPSPSSSTERLPERPGAGSGQVCHQPACGPGRGRPSGLQRAPDSGVGTRDPSGSPGQPPEPRAPCGGAPGPAAGVAPRLLRVRDPGPALRPASPSPSAATRSVYKHRLSTYCVPGVIAGPREMGSSRTATPVPSPGSRSPAVGAADKLNPGSPAGTEGRTRRRGASGLPAFLAGRVRPWPRPESPVDSRWRFPR